MSDENPFQAQGSEVAEPRPDRTRRRVLTFYWQHRDGKMQFISLLRPMALRWGIYGLYLAAVTWIVLKMSIDGTAWGLATGFILGAMLRDFTLLRRTWQVWPTLHSVLDWAKIEREMDRVEARHQFQNGPRPPRQPAQENAGRRHRSARSPASPATSLSGPRRRGTRFSAPSSAADRPLSKIPIEPIPSTRR